MSQDNGTAGEKGKVISFTKARKEHVEEKRRKYERILFKQILGAYCLIENEGLKAIELVDLSNEGLSFQLPLNSKNLTSIKEGKVITLRLYFSEQTYLPVVLKIENKRPCIENGQQFQRFGCSISKDTQSFAAYHSFVTFLAQYAEASHQDGGEHKVHYF